MLDRSDGHVFDGTRPDLEQVFYTAGCGSDRRRRTGVHQPAGGLAVIIVWIGGVALWANRSSDGPTRQLVIDHVCTRMARWQRRGLRSPTRRLAMAGNGAPHVRPHRAGAPFDMHRRHWFARRHAPLADNHPRARKRPPCSFFVSRGELLSDRPRLCRVASRQHLQDSTAIDGSPGVVG